jgi:hypothetical protein
MSSIDFLLQSQNADGGWSYRANAASVSYVESTAAVLLALPDTAERARMRGIDFLLSIQHADGGWGIASIDSESGWMTAWAIRALVDLNASNAVERGCQWLFTTEGIRIEDPIDRAENYRMLKIDSTLRGWPWQSGDAAWVHPTSLAMLALIAAGHGEHSRVADGATYLFDRAAPNGGWNIGNPWMIDKQIPATIQDTAVALQAFRALKQFDNDLRVVHAIIYLRQAIARAQTPAELAWGIVALREWNVDVSDALNRLKALQLDDGSWQGNPFITAVAMIANKM